MPTVSLRLDAPLGPLFDYLADPRNRPEWQSSLRRVDEVSGSGELGTTWYDVTMVGARPWLEVSDYQPGELWAEHGRWHGLEASLVVRFSPLGERRTELTVTVDFWGRGIYRVAGWGMTALTPLGVRSDLRRAARLVSSRYS